MVESFPLHISLNVCHTNTLLGGQLCLFKSPQSCSQRNTWDCLAFLLALIPLYFSPWPPWAFSSQIVSALFILASGSAPQSTLGKVWAHWWMWKLSGSLWGRRHLVPKLLSLPLCLLQNMAVWMTMPLLWNLIQGVRWKQMEWLTWLSKVIFQANFKRRRKNKQNKYLTWKMKF